MYKNHEGYPDPAAGAAIREADRPPEDYRKTVRMMLFTAKCSGGRMRSREVVAVNVQVDALESI